MPRRGPKFAQCPTVGGVRGARGAWGAQVYTEVGMGRDGTERDNDRGRRQTTDDDDGRTDVKFEILI